MMRINKFIAKSGLCSRRKADQLIKEKKVSVNGKIVDDFSFDVGRYDKVEVCGKAIGLEEKFYYKLNKPVGYISSNFDPHNDKDLQSLVDIDQRFFCAGRLDMDSRGLMLITNDGDMVNRLIHPKYEIAKEYLVQVDKLLDKRSEFLFLRPIKLGQEEVATGQKLLLLDKKNRIYKIIIHQGYKRQIRRMFKAFESEVVDLKRTKIGDIELGDLEEGQVKKLNDNELKYLKSL